MLLIEVKLLAGGDIPTYLSRLKEIAHVVDRTPEMEIFFYRGKKQAAFLKAGQEFNN